MLMTYPGSWPVPLNPRTTKLVIGMPQTKKLTTANHRSEVLRKHPLLLKRHCPKDPKLSPQYEVNPKKFAHNAKQMVFKAQLAEESDLHTILMRSRKKLA